MTLDARTISPIIKLESDTLTVPNSSTLYLPGRQTRAESVGCCLGISAQDESALGIQHQQYARLRRRSTRHTKDQSIKAGNLLSW